MIATFQLSITEHQGLPIVVYVLLNYQNTWPFRQTVTAQCNGSFTITCSAVSAVFLPDFQVTSSSIVVSNKYNAARG
uniref:Neur_chan_LBD domain-containing protein n=1 Tax=Steinernema glaseri TaxID=37863 RepID=A0A1I7ZT32_9BILA